MKQVESGNGQVEVGVDQSQFQQGPKKFKIVIGLSETAKDRLFELKRLTKRDAAAPVVRDALRSYDILVEETVVKGGELFLQPGDGGELVRLKLV